MISVKLDELSPKLARAVDILVNSGNPIKEVMEGDTGYDPCICLKDGRDIQLCRDGFYCITRMDGPDVKYVTETRDFDKVLEALAGF